MGIDVPYKKNIKTHVFGIHGKFKPRVFLLNFRHLFLSRGGHMGIDVSYKKNIKTHAFDIPMKIVPNHLPVI